MDEFVWTMRTMLKAWPHNYFHMASRGEVKNLVSSIDRFKMPFPAQMGYLDAKCIGTLWKKVTAFARLSVHQSLLHSFFLFFFVSFLVRHRSEGKEEKKRFEKHVHPMITFRQIRQLWCNFYQINRNIWSSKRDRHVLKNFSIVAFLK